MQGIEFEEDRNYQINTGADRQTATSRPSSIMKMVFKMGVSDPATVNYILLGLAAIFFGVAIFLYAGILGETKPQKMTAQQQLIQARTLMEMQGSRPI